MGSWELSGPKNIKPNFRDFDRESFSTAKGSRRAMDDPNLLPRIECLPFDLYLPSEADDLMDSTGEQVPRKTAVVTPLGRNFVGAVSVSLAGRETGDTAYGGFSQSVASALAIDRRRPYGLPETLGHSQVCPER